MFRTGTAPSPARPSRRTPSAALAVLTAVAVAAGVAACQPDPPAASVARTSASPAGVPAGRPEHDGRAERAGEDDGTVPSGTTVFDDDLPALANLAPALRTALEQAATAAEEDGVTFVVNSGWRSRDYQAQLLREAVAQYGSAAAAARWVAPADTSSHVTGDAVDLAQNGGTVWLAGHGAAYGLCPVYANEPWHYELRPDAPDAGCPAPYADATADPRTSGAG
ncbi:D-alanyl-D-alanine carboxypeptidase family protein [Isoptericola sp. NPDC055881]